jgi:uncharacterized membrane protein YhaH (DUF805 family)
VVGIIAATTIEKGPHVLARAIWFFFRFDGRIGRIPYLAGVVAAACVGFWVYWIVLALVHESGAAVAFWLALPLVLWITWAVSLKRAHDFNRSWGTALGLIVLGLVPYIGVLSGLVMLAWPGTAGDNEYGPGTGWKNRPRGAEA